MADESTDKGNRNQFEVVVKYLRLKTVENMYVESSDWTKQPQKT